VESLKTVHPRAVKSKLAAKRKRLNDMRQKPVNPYVLVGSGPVSGRFDKLLQYPMGRILDGYPENRRRQEGFDGRRSSGYIEPVGLIEEGLFP
jgi:hypothetical protein